jgi:hypothetical protein
VCAGRWDGTVFGTADRMKAQKSGGCVAITGALKIYARRAEASAGLVQGERPEGVAFEYEVIGHTSAT